MHYTKKVTKFIEWSTPRKKSDKQKNIFDFSFPFLKGDYADTKKLR